MIAKKTRFKQRRTKVRAKLRKVSDRLRLSVFRSSKHIYCQIIDDDKAKTLVAASDKELKLKKKKLTRVEIANQVGELIAKKAKLKKVSKVYLDRGGYQYRGRIKALAEGARQGGLKL